MIYTALSEEHMAKYLLSKSFVVYEMREHPRHSKVEAEKLQQREGCIIVYEPCVLDYIDPEKLMFVDMNGNVCKFSSYFKEELKYMFPGEIVLNRCKIIGDDI